MAVVVPNRLVGTSAPGDLKSSKGYVVASEMGANEDKAICAVCVNGRGFVHPEGRVESYIYPEM